MAAGKEAEARSGRSRPAAWLAGLLLALAACTHPVDVEPPSVPAPIGGARDVVPGRYGLGIDSARLQRTVRADGLACVIQTFPIDARGAFERSVRGALEPVFDLGGDPSADGNDGSVLVRVTGFEPTFQADFGLVAPSFEAEVDLAALLHVRRAGGVNLVEWFSARGRGSANGPGCASGGEAIGTATREAIGRIARQMEAVVAASPVLRSPLPKPSAAVP